MGSPHASDDDDDAGNFGTGGNFRIRNERCAVYGRNSSKNLKMAERLEEYFGKRYFSPNYVSVFLTSEDTLPVPEWVARSQFQRCKHVGTWEILFFLMRSDQLSCLGRPPHFLSYRERRIDC